MDLCGKLKSTFNPGHDLLAIDTQTPLLKIAAVLTLDFSGKEIIDSIDRWILVPTWRRFQAFLFFLGLEYE